MDQTTTVNKKDLHNLKSGLAAVLGYIQLAELKLNSKDNNEKKEVLDLLQKAKDSAISIEKQILKMEGINEPLVDL